MSNKTTYSICRTSIHNHKIKPIQDDRVYQYELVSKYNGSTFIVWLIDLTPDELLEFCKSVGAPVIISLVGEPIDDGNWEWALEIYDDYRE